jgi:hypothetical protein
MYLQKPYHRPILHVVLFWPIILFLSLCSGSILRFCRSAEIPNSVSPQLCLEWNEYAWGSSPMKLSGFTSGKVTLHERNASLRCRIDWCIGEVSCSADDVYINKLDSQKDWTPADKKPAEHSEPSILQSSNLPISRCSTPRYRSLYPQQPKQINKPLALRPGGRLHLQHPCCTPWCWSPRLRLDLWFPLLQQQCHRRRPQGRIRLVLWGQHRLILPARLPRLWGLHLLCLRDILRVPHSEQW